MLLKAGVNGEGNSNLNLNAQDNLGKTALHYTVKQNNVAAADKLLKAGANVEAKDKEGRTILYHALDNAIKKGDPRLPLQLAKAGAKAPLLKDEQGRTLLHNAVLDK